LIPYFFFGRSASKNKFVHLALQHTIALAVEMNGAAIVREKLSQGVDITIVGDNDFYSQRAKVCIWLSLKNPYDLF